MVFLPNVTADSFVGLMGDASEFRLVEESKRGAANLWTTSSNLGLRNSCILCLLVLLGEM